MRRYRDSRDAHDRSERLVRAPRGDALSCKGWLQEAALRMLMNNLDPEVAERPGGPGRLRRHRQGGAQLGRASTRSSRRCARSSDDETLLVQSGKPVGVFRTHAERAARADRQLEPRPQWATWEDSASSSARA